MEPDVTEVSPVFEGTEEYLDVGRARPPSRWRWALSGPLARGAAAMVIAAAVVGALLTRHATSGTTDAAPSPGTRTTAAAAAEPHVVQVVRMLAARRPGLVDYARSSSARGACVLVNLGSAPQNRVAALLGQTFAGFHVMSIARTIDEFGQLCELRLLARNSHDTTLVFRVVSPPQARADRATTGPDVIGIGGDSDGVQSISYVSVTTTQGWSMLVGSVGPVADQPASNDMLHMAENPAVRW